MKHVKPGHEKPIVCLDAGHYGRYNQSPVLKSYYESEAMWKLTQYEKEALERRGIEVRLTRSSQSRDLEPVARGKRSAGADLLESNHSNACGTETVDRPVVICLVDDQCGEMDELSREAGELVGRTVRDTMKTRGQTQVTDRRAGKDRDGDGKKNDDYYGVLFGAHQAGTPAFICEHSFHTNLRSARWLSDDDNLRRLAEAKAETLARWFGMEEPAPPEGAAAHDPELKGTYRVTADSGLNLRRGAGTAENRWGKDKSVCAVMPKGAKVRCYGYYTALGNTRWLLVQYSDGEVTHTGFASRRYLKKE